MRKKTGLIIIPFLAALLILGSACTTPASIGGGSSSGTGSGSGIVMGSVSCTDSGITGVQTRYIDDLASTNTYLAATVYHLPLSDGEVRVASPTLQTDGTFSASANVSCTSDGTRWQTVAVSTKDVAHSVVGPEFVAEGATVKNTLVGKKYGSLQFKVEDKVTGGAQFFNVSGNAGTGYQSFNGSRMTVSNNDGTGTSLTLAEDDFIDMTIYTKTNTTKRQFGEDGLNTWMLVDAGGDQWDEPVVAIDGRTLNDQITALKDTDRRKYSGYEYAYNLGPIGDRESEIDVFLQSASGVNPSTDPVFDFCSEGRYDSQKQVDTILVGCWTDAATQLQVSTGRLHQFIVDIT